MFPKKFNILGKQYDMSKYNSGTGLMFKFLSAFTTKTKLSNG